MKYRCRVCDEESNIYLHMNEPVSEEHKFHDDYLLRPKERYANWWIRNK